VVGEFASVNLLLHHKVQKSSSSTGKRAVKRLWWCGLFRMQITRCRLHGAEVVSATSSEGCSSLAQLLLVGAGVQSHYTYSKSEVSVTTSTYLLFCLFDSRDGGVTDRMRESYRELEQERARLLSENAVLDEEVKELQRYIDSHLGRSGFKYRNILAHISR